MGDVSSVPSITVPLQSIWSSKILHRGYFNIINPIKIVVSLIYTSPLYRLRNQKTMLLSDSKTFQVPVLIFQIFVTRDINVNFVYFDQREAAIMLSALAMLMIIACRSNLSVRKPVWPSNDFAMLLHSSSLSIHGVFECFIVDETMYLRVCYMCRDRNHGQRSGHPWKKQNCWRPSVRAVSKVRRDSDRLSFKDD